MVRKVMRLPAILAATGWKKATLYAKIADKKFPEGTKLDPEGRTVVWFEDQIEAWQKNATSDGVAPPRRGRPKVVVGQRKVRNMTFRYRGDLHDRLAASAEANGRSLSEEIEQRLISSLTPENTEAIIDRAIAKFDARHRAALGIQQSHALGSGNNMYSQCLSPPLGGIQNTPRHKALTEALEGCGG